MPNGMFDTSNMWALDEALQAEIIDLNSPQVIPFFEKQVVKDEGVGHTRDHKQFKMILMLKYLSRYSSMPLMKIWKEVVYLQNKWTSQRKIQVEEENP